jgi:hypothetical protein
VTYETMLLIAAGAVGVVIFGVLIVVFLSFKNWVDKGLY